MTKPAELYACLYVREFPAQALLRLRSELHDKSCVVMDCEPPLEVVCSLNTKARLLGLRYGMTRVEVDTFVEPVVMHRSLQAEKATKAILLECAGAFSPRLEDCTDALTFACGIDIAGTQSLFGPPEMLAKSLRQRISSLGISGRVTVSSNLHAAICLAKGLTHSVLQVVPQGKEATALSSLPLTALDLTETQAETFAMWGIHTLGMLAALPEKELVSRMGQDGKRLHQLAGGELPHLFQPVEISFTLEERTELDFPLDDLESLMFGLSVMLEQLILRAKARIVALASVTIKLHLEGGGSHTRTVRSALPTNDKQLWVKLLHLDLEAHPPYAAILTVDLHAEPGSNSKMQLGLYSPQLPEPGRLDMSLTRIAALVGEGNVGQAVLDDTHAPESFHLEPFQVPSDDSSPMPSQLQVCLRQLRPPQQLSVTLDDTRPASFFFRNQRCVVERAYGPWLKSGEWWEETIWGQEQWDLVARTQDGELLLCCMIRDLIQDQWQLVALYD
jgi:protein ImuB